MPDVAIPVALGTSGAIYGSALAIGVPEPLALPVALAAAVGAAMALSNGGRIEYNTRELISALVVFSFAWCLGAFGAPAAFWFVASYYPSLASHLPTGAVLPLLALLVAAYGQSRVVPFIFEWLASLRGGKSNG